MRGSPAPSLPPLPNNPLLDDTDFTFDEPNPAVPTDGLVTEIDMGSSAPVPSNKELIHRARRYEEQLPSLMAPKIEEIREFFLMQVLPLLASIKDGMGDGVDVVRLALDETPETTAFTRVLTELVKSAITAKTVQFVAKYAELDVAASHTYMAAHISTFLPNQTDDTVQTLLREVLKISNVSRPSEREAKVRMRQVPEVKGDKRHK